VFSACRNVFTRGQSNRDAIVFHCNVNVEILFEEWFEDLMKPAWYVQEDALVFIRAFCFQVKLL